MRVKYLPQDHEARLNGGIVFYDEKPYYLALASTTEAQLQPIYRKESSGSFIVKLNDPKIDISSPKLGFVNTKTEAVYVMRAPARRYKQLLQYTMATGEAVMTGNMYGGDRLHDIIHSSNGEKMLVGDYPSLETVRKILEESVSKVTSRAISRNIAIARDSYDILRVYYKLDLIGNIDRKTNTVKIPKGENAWVVSKYLEGYDWKVE
jgi:hypothetical protein